MLTSIAARNGGGFGVSLYAAAKGGVEALSRNVPAMNAYANLRIHLHLSRLYIDRDQDSVETRQQHAEILEAILAGRSKDAAARMKLHLRSSRDKLLE